MELDDVLLHTFICDENFGYIANPSSKDPEYEFFMEEIKQPVLVYMRNDWQKFIKYLKDNKDMIEPIIYTTALSPYTAKLMEIVDPKREVFNTFLFQNACYIFEIKEENVLYLVKDISRFNNRDIKRSVLLDSKPINFMMTPENAIPVMEYNANFASEEDEKSDDYLMTLMEELDEIKEFEDVRPVLQSRYNVRELLKNSKLI